MEEKQNDFLMVHHRDSKTQRITKVTDYIRHVQKFGGESHYMYERDGKFYYESGDEVKSQDNFILNPPKVEVATVISAKK